MKTSLATVNDSGSFTRERERERARTEGCLGSDLALEESRAASRLLTATCPLHSEARQTSLPLKALPYWHFKQPFDTMYVSDSPRKLRYSCVIGSFSCVFVSKYHQIRGWLPLKGKQWKHSTDCKPFIKMDTNLKRWWNEVYLLKIFYQGFWIRT
jgi:hypothetical protein